MSSAYCLTLFIIDLFTPATPQDYNYFSRGGAER